MTPFFLVTEAQVSLGNGAQSVDNTNVGYTGHQWDNDSGLNYMQARYYDPLIGRFMSNDPVGFRGIHSFNRYAYANNNPYKYIDPDGETAVEIVLTIAAADAVTPEPTDLAAPLKILVYGGAFILANLVDSIVDIAVLNEISSDDPSNNPHPADTNPDRNPKKDKKLSDKEAQGMKEQGDDPHELKDYDSKKDLFKDKKGNVYIKPKKGNGFGEPTGINLNDYKK